MKLVNVSKKYISKNKDVSVLKEINFQFNDTKLYLIVGKSGSGKTTLLNILGLIDNISMGEYYLNEIDTKTLSDEEKANLRMKHFGFVFQDFYLDEHLTAFENVLVPTLINKEYSKQEREKIARDLLNEMELSDRITHYPHQLSGGEKQRVAIARALVNNPKVILCDEPTGNLDEENSEKIYKILKSLSEKGHIVIVVSHDKEITEYADEVITIKSGKMCISDEA